MNVLYSTNPPIGLRHPPHAHRTYAASPSPLCHALLLRDISLPSIFYKYFMRYLRYLQLRHCHPSTTQISSIFLPLLLRYTSKYHPNFQHYYCIILQVAQFHPSYYKNGSHDHRLDLLISHFFIMSSTDFFFTLESVTLYHLSLTTYLLISSPTWCKRAALFHHRNTRSFQSPRRNINDVLFYYERRLVSSLIQSLQV